MTPSPLPPPQTRAEQAWAAHQAVMQAEARDPGLRSNPVWRCLKMDAFEAFHNAFIGERR